MTKFGQTGTTAHTEANTVQGEQPVKTIIIAGGGTAGWMTAAAFSRYLDPARTRLILIESEAIGTVGVGEATIPAIIDFNRILGIDENTLLKQTGGTFKLGIEFCDWGRIGQHYFHPFGFHGLDLEGLHFHQYWAWFRHAGSPHAIDEYSIAWHAARAGKFLRPTNDPQSPLSQIRYAFHFDASLYAACLRTYAEKRGVIRQEGRIVDVNLDAETGYITALTLESGLVVSGDLFVDCTGFRALLSNAVSGADHVDWTHWLPCDRAVALACERTQPPCPFTRATARAAGWQWRIPLQHRTGNGHVFSSAFMSEDEALAILTRHLDGKPVTEPNVLRFQTGRRRKFWTRNCVAIGLSAGFLEPLESTSIHLVQEGISQLIALMPAGAPGHPERDTYNRIIGKKFDMIRNFLILHYHASERSDSGFWNHVRTMSIPDELQACINLFRRSGSFSGRAGDLFPVTSWVAVLLGQNILPRHHHPFIDSMDPECLQATLDDFRSTYALATQKMPPHDKFLERFCKANTA